MLGLEMVFKGFTQAKSDSVKPLSRRVLPNYY